MLPSRRDSARSDLLYERQPAQPIYHPQPYAFTQRAPYELPRPLEPRPSLHTSLSDSAGTQRNHHDSFRATALGAPDYRSQGPSLPGLRDILTASPHPPSHQPYEGAQWSTNAGSLSRYQSRDAYASHTGLHPPQALQPPTEPTQGYPSGRRVDLPLLESSPVPRHPPQSQPTSPFNGYPEAHDYVEGRADRARQPSATPYPTNGVMSPYTRPSENGQYPSSGADGDRPAPFPIPGMGKEPQRKYLGVKEVAGEGAYHLYEGGYRIPTQVDGEQVNPAWGLTKANKPRKRLALACLDCREKKIKCEPGTSSCLQCEKAKRHCRRAPLHPPQSEGATTPPAWQNSTSPPVRKGVSDPTPQVSHEHETDMATKRRSREDSSPPNVPTKKHRSMSPNAMLEGISTSLVEVKAATTPVTVQNTAESYGSKMLTWDEDPYAVDRDTTMHLLDLYFAHVNDATYSIFPRKTFMQWVARAPHKCQLDRMVLYAMLAVGSIFADSHYSGFAKQCVQIAKDAVSTKTGVLKLPVVHARLLLAIHETAKGANESSWEYAGSAIRACTSTTLELQVEGAMLKDGEEEGQSPAVDLPLGLSREQFRECKRRTLWSCFLMDRYQHGHLCAITVHDIFLRLPCSEEAYERGLQSDAPYFNNGIIDASQTILTPTSPICTMAWACLLAAIWGDVFTFRHRMQYQSELTFVDAYELFYVETYNRLQGWSSRLPDYLQYSGHNLSRSMREGYGSAFVSIHALYHLLLIRLNRYVRHRCLDPARIKRNIRACHHHAHALLGMMDAIRSTAPRSPSGESRQLDLVFSAPFVGNAIMGAIDIASAGGPDSNMKATQNVVTTGLDCLRILAKYWNSAKNQLRSSQTRLYSMRNIFERPVKARGGAWLGRDWGILEPLEKESEREHDWAHDCIYTDEQGYSSIYFDALREDDNQARIPASGSVRIV